MTIAELVRQQEREQEELAALLEAACQAAMADTLAGMWAHVLGVRTVLVAAGQPPNGDGLEITAKRLWAAGLSRWVKPVVAWAWKAKSGPAFDRQWEALSQRMLWTADLVSNAVGAVLAQTSRQSPDQQRSAVAEVLDLDGIALSLWEQIYETERELLDPSLSRTDRDAAFARRVRLQTNVFLPQAARARSKGFAALAKVDQDNAEDWRRLAREASRTPATIRKEQTALARHDEKLFHNPELDPDKLARLTTKLHKLNGDDRHGHESWRNSVTRDARAVATGLLNASRLQYGIEQAQASGQEWIKRWAATLTDDRTRPTHLDADGQVRSILDTFSVGVGELDHPADFDAPAEEFWGCRCSMIVMSRASYDEIAGALTASTLEETMSEPAPEELGDLAPLMWHGIVTLEGTYTGDRRYFRDGAIRTQPLPAPIRFQREDWGGHSGSVVVANAEAARRYEKKIRAWGTFADGALTPEVDEVVGLIATRMMRGISIDGDDVLDSQFTMELDDDANVYEMYDSMRIRGATLCAIPAFDGAEVYLGPPPPEWLLEGEPISTEQNEVGRTRSLDEIPDSELESMLAASRVPENLAEYWTGPEGSARVGGWGSPGSYTRCLSQLAEYVAPGQVAGTCANLYHRATGEWPGRQKGELALPYLLSSVATDELTTAEIEKLWKFSHEDFAPKPLTELTPIVITDDGYVYGHLAGWHSCHQGYSDVCVTPPRSTQGYSLFHTGAVRLDDGTDLPIGKLTVGAGHANPNGLGVRGATAHYDNSALAVAMVRAVEDNYGIQVSGRIIPGTPQDKIEELRRSPISGDWRTYRGNLEMVAALGVNSPGFLVPRAMVASVEGRQTSLLWAGYVPRDLDAEVDELAIRMHAPIVASLAARMEPTPAELDHVSAKLAARMASLTTED